jgi:hypothetical protein
MIFYLSYAPVACRERTKNACRIFVGIFWKPRIACRDHIKIDSIEIWGPFAKFVDSPYYSESELCGGAMTVTFSKYLPWQAIYFLNAPPTSRKWAANRWSLRNFLPLSSIFMVGKDQKSHGTRSELNSLFGLEKVDRRNPIRTLAIQSRSRPMRFLDFSNHEKGVQGKKFQNDQRSAARFREVGGAL